MNFLKKRDLLIPSGASNWWGTWEADILASKVISSATVYQLANSPSWYLYQREAYNSSETEYVLHNIDQAIPASVGSIGRRLKIVFPAPYGVTTYAYFHPYPVVSDGVYFGYLRTSARPISSTGNAYIWTYKSGEFYYLVMTTEHSTRMRYCYDNDSDEFYFCAGGGQWKFPVKDTAGAWTDVNVSITAEDDDAYKLIYGSFPIGVYKNRNNKEALIGFVLFDLKSNGSGEFDANCVMSNYATYPSDRIVDVDEQVPEIMARGTFSNGLSIYMDLTDYYSYGQFKTSQSWRIYQTDLSYWEYAGILPYNSDMSDITFTRVWAGDGDDPYDFSLTLSFSEYLGTLGGDKNLTIYTPIIDNGHWQ